MSIDALLRSSNAWRMPHQQYYDFPLFSTSDVQAIFVAETEISANGKNEAINGDKAASEEKEKTITKAIVNGTDNGLNGDAKNDLDCDISSSDNTKLVSNGSGLDDLKSSKSDESADTVIIVPSNKVSKKKENSGNKKNKTNDDTDDKKKDTKKHSEIKEDEEKSSKIENVIEKVNGGSNDIVNGDKQRESSPSEDGDDKKRDAEVVFIQDLGFTVKIVSPGAEPLDIQVRIPAQRNRDRK